MGSTDFNAPPLRVILMAIIMVVGLHVLMAVALVMIKKPAPVIEPPKVTPPIEIQLVTLPIEINEINEINEPEVKAVVPIKKEVVKEEAVKENAVKKVKPNPQPAPKSEPVPKPIVKEPIKSITPVEQKVKPDTSSPAKIIATKPVVSQKQPQQEMIAAPSVDSITADEHRRILAAQVQLDAQREAETQAQTQTDRMAEDARIKAEKQAAEKQAQEAAREAAARVKAQAEAAAKASAAAANNTVVNFTASNAHWASKPSFSFPNRAKRGTRSGDTFNVVLVLRVNKQGGIDSVNIAQSSGNAMLDKEAQRQVRSGKFKPFMKNEVTVIGHVTLPISYVVP